MSGPIVRKYGFPNFDKIFGERPLQHGADEEADPKGDAQSKGTSQKKSGGRREKSSSQPEANEKKR